MASKAAHAEDDTGVLDRSIDSQKLASDDADAWEIGPGDQLGEPIGMSDFNVVIEEQKEIAVGFAGRAIVDRTVVERAGMPENADARIGGESFQVLFGGGFLTAVIDDEDFNVWVLRDRQQRRDGTGKKIELISGGNDD